MIAMMGINLFREPEIKGSSLTPRASTARSRSAGRSSPTRVIGVDLGGRRIVRLHAAARSFHLLDSLPVGMLSSDRSPVCPAPKLLFSYPGSRTVVR